MSPVGHSLVGLTFASVAVSHESRTSRWKSSIAIVFVALASLPDWPLPGWGHDRYDISHSIFVNVGLIAFVIMLWRTVPRLRSNVSTRTLLFAASAWLSHLLLDSFYNHGRGVAICWPFSDARLRLPIPWFSTLDLSQPIASRRNVMVGVIEFLAYTPILVAAFLLTRMRERISSSDA